MNKWQKLTATTSFVLLGGAALIHAFSKSPSPVPNTTPVFAQNDWKPPVSDLQPVTVASNNPPTAPETTTAPQAPANDGKTEIPTDGKTVIPTDGKEVLPSGKEALPPVGQFINSQPQNVDPSQIGPPTEYRNPPILNAPNPTNVSGPVVSAETP